MLAMIALMEKAALSICLGICLGICLLLMSPLFILIALVIKFSSPGSVFYKQMRVGQYGKTFFVYKFRTMPENIEQTSGPAWSMANDPRPFKFGHLLRFSGLDELPQLLNVIKGDMAFIGPRPERPFFVKQFNITYCNYSRRHLVKPGIIGWAQINGWRGNSSLKRRLACDLYYLENRSLWLKIKILFFIKTKQFARQCG